MNRSDRKPSNGILHVKGTMRGVAVNHTTCDEYGHRSFCSHVFLNKDDFMKFIVANYWNRPTNPNGGDT